jgi:glycerophosphoryl diester phosphodiesterase
MNCDRDHRSAKGGHTGGLCPKTPDQCCEIVAHRGAREFAIENSLAAFQKAIELGADAIELDVRLTADGVPIVFHYAYLEETTDQTGSVFASTWRELQAAHLVTHAGSASPGALILQDGMLFVEKIPTLHEAIECILGKSGLEIEIKGPEPESAAAVADILLQYRPAWDCIEVTSYEPALLLDIQHRCPGLATDLLIPRSEPWMRLDVVEYFAIQRARLAHARAVHMHPTQITAQIVDSIRRSGIDVHAWDVNDPTSLEVVMNAGIRRLCTDRLTQMCREVRAHRAVPACAAQEEILK